MTTLGIFAIKKTKNISIWFFGNVPMPVIDICIISIAYL
jgi:hypothetical protein